MQKMGNLHGFPAVPDGFHGTRQRLDSTKQVQKRPGQIRPA
jgi:hypothetical protein